MLAIRLDPKLEARVAAMAKASNKTKSEIVREAVVRLLEDTEDLDLAERAIAGTKSTKALTKLRKELGVDR